MTLSTATGRISPDTSPVSTELSCAGSIGMMKRNPKPQFATANALATWFRAELRQREIKARVRRNDWRPPTGGIKVSASDPRRLALTEAEQRSIRSIAFDAGSSGGCRNSS